MQTNEIVLPETEPESEWIRGRAVQKVSPKRDHGRVQMLLGLELHRWSQGRGEVATEWRFRIAPPGEVRRPQVPDIAFVANDLLRGLSHEDAQAPTFAPTVAVEILSAGDDRQDVASKIDVYLRAGTALVIIVDPARRTLTAHDSAQTVAFCAPETFRHEALAGFELALEPFFSEALDLPSS